MNTQIRLPPFDSWIVYDRRDHLKLLTLQVECVECRSCLAPASSSASLPLKTHGKLK